MTKQFTSYLDAVRACRARKLDPLTCIERVDYCAYRVIRRRVA